MEVPTGYASNKCTSFTEIHMTILVSVTPPLSVIMMLAVGKTIEFCESLLSDSTGT
jgi:hypothetical protein